MTTRQRTDSAARRRGGLHREGAGGLVQPAIRAGRRFRERTPFPVGGAAQWEMDRAALHLSRPERSFP